MSDIVSIIITTYKRPELLRRSLRSALAQTYDNLEVIVVNDNNPESDARKETECLINDEFEGCKSLIYLRLPQNSGACYARNYGVKKSNGKYINFLDDDDEMYPEKIAKQMAVFESDKEEKLSAVGCYGIVVNENGEHVSDIIDEVRGDVFYRNMCNIVAVTSQVLIRKETYLKSGGFEKMHSSQDHWMLIRLFSVQPYYDIVPEKLVKIYHHSGSRISTDSNKPLGAIELEAKCTSFYSRLTPVQIENVKRIRNEHIISAFLNQGRRKEGLKFWIAGLKKRHSIDYRDVNLLIVIIIGKINYSKIVSFISKIKHKINK